MDALFLWFGVLLGTGALVFACAVVVAHAHDPIRKLQIQAPRNSKGELVLYVGDSIACVMSRDRPLPGEYVELDRVGDAPSSAPSTAFPRQAAVKQSKPLLQTLLFFWKKTAASEQTLTFGELTSPGTFRLIYRRSRLGGLTLPFAKPDTSVEFVVQKPPIELDAGSETATWGGTVSIAVTLSAARWGRMPDAGCDVVVSADTPPLVGGSPWTKSIPLRPSTASGSKDAIWSCKAGGDGDTVVLTASFRPPYLGRYQAELLMQHASTTPAASAAPPVSVRVAQSNAIAVMPPSVAPVLSNVSRHRSPAGCTWQAQDVLYPTRPPLSAGRTS
jgi:hypothetical protein